MAQHGTVLSEILFEPGPTDSVFDFLAALISLRSGSFIGMKSASGCHERPHRHSQFPASETNASVITPPHRSQTKPAATQSSSPANEIAVLGFAGGSLMAPLQFLQVDCRVQAVDLDRTGHELFRRHCSYSQSDVEFTEADAVDWLLASPQRFDVILDDLSVPVNGDVFKPDCSFMSIPQLARQRLKPNGWLVCNCLKPEDATWDETWRPFHPPDGSLQCLYLDGFENRILISGKNLPEARAMSHALRSRLRQLGSRQADRFHLRTVARPE